MSVFVAATERVRGALWALNEELDGQGIPGFQARGKLIRPLVAYAAVRSEPRPEFWYATGAVQLAHEASLVHDDIVDAARERRGEATLVARKGIGPALVHGDHLLTAAYRLAAKTHSLPFVELFARSVERTVAGEREQGARSGERLSEEAYRNIVIGKSGELLGCALAIQATLADAPDAPSLFQLGRRIGLFYQMLDDFIDYCPGARTGKEPFKDWSQRRWTWPLFHVDDVDFTWSAAEISRRFHSTGATHAPAQRCLEALDRCCESLIGEIHAALPGDTILCALLDAWQSTAHRAIADARPTNGAASGQPTGSAIRSLRESEPRVAITSVPDPVTLSPEMRARLEALDWRAALPSYGKSFAFASRWFPVAWREQVTRVYAYCRFTDDLVDAAGDRPADAVARDLDAWLAMSRIGYAGEPSGSSFLDAVMSDAAAARVPFRYIEQLVEGVRMDLHATRFETLGELQGYTYRVASVVGLWMCALFGVHRTPVLARAATLGHAMQLTNILRDVGEDLDRGRLYLPLHNMRENGLTVRDLWAMRAGARITPEYSALLEELIAIADIAYDAAFLAIPELPQEAQSPVAVATYVYRGIHDAIRANGHDNLTKRAHTTVIQKARLAAAALRTLRKVASDRPLATLGSDGSAIGSFAHP